MRGVHRLRRLVRKVVGAPAHLAAGGHRRCRDRCRGADRPHVSPGAKRLEAKHAKIATTITTLAADVEDTKRLLFRRSTWTSVLGVMSYLVFRRARALGAFIAVRLVPLIGGAIAYAILRRRFGPNHLGAASEPTATQTGARGG